MFCGVALLPNGTEPADLEAPQGFTWPAGEIGDALRGIGPEVEPEQAPEILWPPEDDHPAWEAGTPWRRWAELVVGRAESPLPSAELAELALLTLAQGRDETAWRQLAELARRSPASAAGVLPQFFPGVPAGNEALAGGRPGPLPEGTLLRPALPPPLGAPDPDFLLEARSMSLAGLAVGAARCDFTVDLRIDGVDLRFETLSGSAHAKGVIPVPPGFAAHAEYADWDRQPETGAAHPVVLDAIAEDPWRLWGRFQRAESGGPTVAPPGLTGQLEHAGLELILDRSDPAYTRLAGLAQAIEIACGVRCRVLGVNAPKLGHTGPSPVRFSLLPNPGRPTKLARLLDLLEQVAERR